MCASLALSPSVFAAHWPISSPAFSLSVAKVASAALGGSSGVSSAITRIPALRARSTEGTIPLVSLGVIRIALAPALIKRSMASTWPVLSPSDLPARLRKSTPSSFAFAAAPSFIFTKNGLVFSLVISPTMILSAANAGPSARAQAATAKAVDRLPARPAASANVRGHAFLLVALRHCCSLCQR